MKSSKTILILFFIFYLFDSFTGGEITSLLSLDIVKISTENEFWRLFSYPLAAGSFESTLLLIFSLGIFAPKLERNYKSYLLPVMIILISLMHGTLFTWLNMYSELSFTGSIGISFFLMFAFIFSNPKAKFQFFKKSGARSVSSTKLIAFVMMLWLGIKAIQYVQFGQEQAIHSMLFAGFGTANSLILLAQIYFMRKMKEKSDEKEERLINKEIDELENELSQIEKDELSLALIASQQKRYKKNQTEETNQLSSDPKENEDKMNALLDKISTLGYDSLSHGEQKFLHEYSKIIK